MSVYDDARGLCPELGSLTDDQMSPWLSTAQGMVGATWYGDEYSTALALALAHCVTRAFANSGGTSGSGTLSGGVLGPLASASNRAASASYGAPIGAGGAGGTSGADADLMMTVPGQMLRAMRDRQPLNSPEVFL